MSEFVSKKIGEKQESIGAILKNARQLRQLSLSQASRITGIKSDYLDAIENNELYKLPDGLYRKNYIKKYAQFLNLEQRMSSRLESAFPEKENEDPFIKKTVTRDKMMVFPNILRNIAILLVFLAFFAYLIFYLKNILSAPYLNISYPDKNMTVTERTIVVEGETSPLANIEINGEEVLNSENGHFSKEVALKEGLNNIVIKAKKKHSKEKTVSRQILLQ